MDTLYGILTFLAFTSIVPIINIISNVKQRKIQQREAARQQELLRLRLEEQQKAEQLKLQTSVETLLPAIRTAYTSLQLLEGHYIANYSFEQWKVANHETYKAINKLAYSKTQLTEEDQQKIKEFIYKISQAEYRSNHNKKFIETSLLKQKDFFSNIEGRQMDIQQQTAVLTDDDNNLIVAGAGSGKTTTIVGKIKYLVEIEEVDPNKILLISFTKKSVKSLADRVNVPGVVARTFHRFGLDVITNATNVIPSISAEDDYKFLISRIFKQRLKSNPEYQDQVNKFFLDGLKLETSAFDCDNHGQYIQFLKDQNFQPYRIVETRTKGRITYRKEKVKSIEECKIANFLFLNGFNYYYEAPYPYKTATGRHRQYKPDFTIEQDGYKLYLEHFAINRKQDVPRWFAKQDESYEEVKKKYIDGINWKREIHNEHGTNLIETYSYENSEGKLFENLTKRLEDQEFFLNPKTPGDIWKIISESGKDDVDGFITLVATFIVLLKSNNYTFNSIKQRVQAELHGRHQERNKELLALIEPLYEAYEIHLKKQGEIDFSDMINKATHYIRSGKYKRIFDYIVIDEFQDMSISRYQLIKALKEKNPYCKLFCVGDDWQSIYRFAGSDISLFKDFETYFGHTVRSNIETTYRYSEPLISKTGEFILKNPNQTLKNLRSFHPEKRTDLQVIHYDQFGQDGIIEVLSKVLIDDILPIKQSNQSLSVLVLGRYNFDIKKIIERPVNDSLADRPPVPFTYLDSSNQIRFVHNQQKLDMTFMSVHKAKGLEADIVILINCNSGTYGFPAGLLDDPILNLLLSSADQFENGEERRLFYVALTRAKEKVYLLADQTFGSKFISELESNESHERDRKCPHCQNGDLVLRQGVSVRGEPWAFMACTNFTYGCEYQKWIDDVVVVRSKPIFE